MAADCYNSTNNNFNVASNDRLVRIWSDSEAENNSPNNVFNFEFFSEPSKDGDIPHSQQQQQQHFRKNKIWPDSANIKHHQLGGGGGYNGGYNLFEDAAKANSGGGRSHNESQGSSLAGSGGGGGGIVGSNEQMSAATAAFAASCWSPLVDDELTKKPSAPSKPQNQRSAELSSWANVYDWINETNNHNKVRFFIG